MRASRPWKATSRCRWRASRCCRRAECRCGCGFDSGTAAMDSQRTWSGAGGAQIFYRLWRSGEGRPVLVLLHGVASNSTRWTEFVRETRLRDSWDLLRIDRRGQGQSVWRGAAGIPEWCDDVGGILAAEGYAPAFAAG